MRIATIGAHPDDMEIGCAGTLLRCIERGDTVTTIVVTDGAAGGRSDNHDLASTREGEAQKAAGIIGSDLIWLGYPDGGLHDTEDLRKAIAEAVRISGADVILTHHPEDYHPDHRVVSQVVFDASFMAGVKGYSTSSSVQDGGTPALPGFPALYYMDTLAGRYFEPDTYVDISDVFQRKCDALACHRSQMSGEQPDEVDFLHHVRTVNGFRGLQSGVRYAEAFIQAGHWPKQETVRQLP